MAASTGSSKIDWLYPELLSKEGLIEILSQRFVKLPDDTESTTRDELLDLYYQFVIPRPQRKYRSNRRGRDMTRRQILQNKKRKITGPSTFEPPAKKSVGESPRLVSSFEGLPSGDRLKPPPSCINFEKKVIKLGSSKPSLDASNSSSSPPVTNSDSSPPKVIKLNRSSSSSSNDAKSPTSQQTISLSKTIKLNNSHASGCGDSVKKLQNNETKEQPMETDSPQPSSEKKVKIKKISWP